MRFVKIADLKTYLETSRMSPEELAKQVKISNMTIRRLLKRKASDNIPEKYLAQFNLFLGDSALSEPLEAAHGLVEDFEALVDDLEKKGKDVNDLNRLKSDMHIKLKDRGIGKAIRSRVTALWKGIASPDTSVRNRAICIGALLYLINPIDLIPDITPGIGYIDDFAVLSLALACLVKPKQSE